MNQGDQKGQISTINNEKSITNYPCQMLRPFRPVFWEFAVIHCGSSRAKVGVQPQRLTMARAAIGCKSILVGTPLLGIFFLLFAP